MDAELNRLFYSESPEYIVYKNEDIEEKENYFNLVSPFYAYNQINSNTLYSYYEFKYHSTVLYACRCISLDSGIYTTPVPKSGEINFNMHRDDTIYYRYFIEETMLYNIHLLCIRVIRWKRNLQWKNFRVCFSL